MMETVLEHNNPIRYEQITKRLCDYDHLHKLNINFASLQYFQSNAMPGGSAIGIHIIEFDVSNLHVVFANKYINVHTSIPHFQISCHERKANVEHDITFAYMVTHTCNQHTLGK